MSENAVEITKRIISLCGDTFEENRYERNTPLIFSKEHLELKPQELEKGDALILFSRKEVLMIAHELNEAGIKASVIYGALPYSVRKEEMRKFIEGETTVVVATDAIGMGLNLPIRRIIFMSGEKFDGTAIVPLTTPQVKQIAGRAGRKGLYDSGIACSISPSTHKMLKESFEKDYVSIKKAGIKFPTSLADRDDCSLFAMVTLWKKSSVDPMFEKTKLDTESRLIYELERYGSLTNRERLKFATIPFLESNEYVKELWRELIFKYTKDGTYNDIWNRVMKENPRNLSYMETLYKKYELLHSFFRTIEFPYDKETLEAKKVELSQKIIQALEKEKRVSSYFRY